MALDETVFNLDLTELAPWAAGYTSDGRELPGYLFMPEGTGPFPGLIFNHGSVGLTAGAHTTAEELTRLGYAVYLPVRRGYNGSPGANHHAYLTAPEESAEWGRQLVDGTSRECDDVLAALAWLQQQARINPARTAILGSSWGGVMVILAAGRTNAFRAGVSFAGPSITWPRAPALQEALLESVRRTAVPLMLLQAQNDHSLAPTYTLGAELARLGLPHELRIYPAVGTEPMESHAISSTSVALWSNDVASFLDRWVPR